MQNFEENDIDSDESEYLNENEIIAMNRHLRNRRSNRGNKMTAEMESLYKDALMDTFFGRFEQASKKLKSHIALCPDHSESYHLLGTMYEELGQYRNAVEYFFMSAYLSSPNFEKWKKVGEMSFDLQMYNQSAYCYGRALKIENYNIELMTRRAQAFEHSHQTKKAISTYKKILSITFSLPILKQYAKLRFKRGEYKTAREILMEYKDHQKDAHLVYMICETFLKEEKFQNLLEYLGEFIFNQKEQEKQEEQFTLDSLNLELTIFLYICLIKLQQEEYAPLKTTATQVKRTLIDSYQESFAKEYEVLITQIKVNEPILNQFLAFLIKFSPHQTIQNYLIYSEILKKDKNFELAIKLLKEALEVHKNSVELTSQLNHIKIVSGNWKQTKRREVFDFKKTIKNQPENQQDIYYSDDEDKKLLDQDFFVHQKPQNSKSKKKPQQKISNLRNLQKSNQNNSLQTEDPEIIKRLLINCNETLQSIVKYHDQETSNVGSYFKQVEDCIHFIINLTSFQKQQADEENEGLFNRNYRKRRYFSSKQSQRQNLINNNIPTILFILESIIQFMKSILKQQQFNKVKHLAQTLSKAYFFRWQNKSIQLRKIKKCLFEIGLLSCMSLQKYETAVFFVRYLVHKEPQNSFYLLIVNYLIHNSSIKIGMSSLLGKYAARNNLMSNMKQISNNGKNSQQKKQIDFFEDEEGSQILSYPRKMSNMSNFSDITRDNLKLNYLFGIEYMETGCFDLAISSFLKVINLSDGEIKKTIWLCLSSCFMQISSSRTCHSKMPNTNSATYCFWQYLNSSEDQVEKMFNMGRFFAQLRMNANAIQIFKEILQKRMKNEAQAEIQQRSAYCLMCIYKDAEDWDNVNQINERYFTVENQNQDQIESQKFN